MKFNKTIKTVTALSAIVALTGCGSSSSAEVEGVDAQETYGCSVINVYNWGEYIGEDVLDTFENAFNAKVN